MKMISIQKKIVITGVLLTVIISTLLFFILNFSIISNVTDLEDSAVLKNISRIENGLKSYKNYLFQKSGDWAKWDASYEFVNGANKEEYIGENFTAESFGILDINVVIYLDKKGNIFFEQGFDTHSQEFYELPAQTAEEIALVRNILNKDANLEHVEGYLTIKDKPPLIFAAHQILKSDGTGPSNGTLIMGRFFDDDINQGLISQTLYPVFIQPIEDQDMPSNLVQAKENLLKGDKPDYIYHTADNNYGYSLHSDIWGKPAFITRVNVPRELVKKYLTTVNYSLFSVFAAGLLLSFMGFIFIKKFALKPLQNLHQAVFEISKGNSDLSKFSIPGNDEVSYLSQEIKKMLENLSETENDLVKKNDELKKINGFMVGRELKMADLKEEIKKLKTITNNDD